MHIQAKHEGIKYSCNQCDSQFTRQDSLKKHVLSHHKGNTREKIYCDQCDHQASTKTELKLHFQSKHEGIKYTCNQCESQFKRKIYLKQHILIIIPLRDAAEYPAKKFGLQLKLLFN